MSFQCQPITCKRHRQILRQSHPHLRNRSCIRTFHHHAAAQPHILFQRESVSLLTPDTHLYRLPCNIHISLLHKEIRSQILSSCQVCTRLHPPSVLPFLLPLHTGTQVSTFGLLRRQSVTIGGEPQRSIPSVGNRDRSFHPIRKRSRCFLFLCRQTDWDTESKYG